MHYYRKRASRGLLFKDCSRASSYYLETLQKRIVVLLLMVGRGRCKFQRKHFYFGLKLELYVGIWYRKVRCKHQPRWIVLSVSHFRLHDYESRRNETRICPYVLSFRVSLVLSPNWRPIPISQFGRKQIWRRDLCKRYFCHVCPSHVKKPYLGRRRKTSTCEFKIANPEFGTTVLEKNLSALLQKSSETNKLVKGCLRYRIRLANRIEIWTSS